MHAGGTSKGRTLKIEFSSTESAPPCNAGVFRRIQLAICVLRSCNFSKTTMNNCYGGGAFVQMDKISGWFVNLARQEFPQKFHRLLKPPTNTSERIQSENHTAQAKFQCVRI